jgi:hypothetical protein
MKEKLLAEVICSRARANEGPTVHMTVPTVPTVHRIFPLAFTM